MANLSGTTWSDSDFIVNEGYEDESRNRYWDTREGDVRAKLLKMTRSKENISFVYRECLRSMLSEFSDLVYYKDSDEVTQVKVIHANPERAVAKLNQEDTIILPIISISQTVSKDDDKRRRNRSLLIHEKVWDPEKSRAYRVLSFSPRAIDIQYDVNIWCKYRSDIDQILEQIRLKFNPEMEVPTKFSTMAKAYLVDEVDVGSIIAVDKEDRVIQRKVGVILRTYIPSPKFLVTATGKIEEFKTEYYFKKPDNQTKPSN